MSYNLCNACGWASGFVNNIIYRCSCPTIAKIKGKYWKLQAIEKKLYIIFDEDRAFYNQLPFDNLTKENKDKFFAEAIWHNWYETNQKHQSIQDRTQIQN